MISRGERTELEVVLSKMRAHFLQEQRWAQGIGCSDEESCGHEWAYGQVVRYIDRLLAGGTLPSMKGYTRDPATVERLVEAVREALLQHPEQRLGQYLVNRCGVNLPDAVDLFQLHDEALIELLRGQP